MSESINKRKTIFPAFEGAISNISAEFQSENSSVLLMVKGMAAGDELRIEFKMGDECDPVWGPLVDCCGQVKLTYPRSFLLLPLPLRYRVVLVDENNNYQTDPSHFSEMLIQSFNIKDRPDLAQFNHGCCDEEKLLCDNISKLPIVDNLVPIGADCTICDAVTTAV